MLKALQMCGANLDDYLHLLVPQIVKAYDLPDNPVDLRRWAGLLDSLWAGLVLCWDASQHKHLCSTS